MLYILYCKDLYVIMLYCKGLYVIYTNMLYCKDFGILHIEHTKPLTLQ